MGELFVMYWVGRNYIEWIVQIVIQQLQNVVNYIVDMDSGQVLFVIVDRFVEVEFKGGCYFVENIVLWSQYYVGVQQVDVGVFVLCFVGNLFLVGVQFMGKFIVWWFFFGYYYFVEVVIVVDGRFVDQYGGRGVVGVDQVYQLLCEILVVMV